jgi:RNA polymerase sigma-70 factor (ECF subfamily)
VQRGLATYEPRSLTGWLSRITTNAFYDEARRRQRRPTTELPDDTERIPGTAPTPDEAAAADTLPEYLQEALMELPIDYRSAVVLCDVVGLSYNEIADIFDLPVGTVRSRIHRGRRRLRDQLENTGVEL